jgi:hypothetical protein
MKKGTRLGGRVDGAKQVRLAGELYGTNHTAEAPYYPRPGEVVGLDFLPGERFEVIEASDPALVTVRNDRGATFRVGWRRVVRLEVAL